MKYRQYTFSMLTKHVGKGEKSSLKRVKVVNRNNKVIRECQDKQSIEYKIVQYNKKYFRKAYSSNAFKDKIYMQLKLDQIRDKILKGKLKRVSCDNDDVFEFLTLLKKLGGYEQNSNGMDDITDEEWIRVVKKAKKKSASLIFSKRTYSVYKCALESSIMTRILVKFYNIVF